MAASWDVVPRPAAVGGGRAARPRRPAAPAAKRLEPRRGDGPGVARRAPAAATRPSRVELGNLYMDAERWDEAIRWYREALGVNPALVETWRRTSGPAW